MKAMLSEIPASYKLYKFIYVFMYMYVYICI